MTAHSQLFTECQAICPKSISIANGDSISAIAAGTAYIAVISDSGASCVDLSGALLAPGLKTNLISVSRLVRQGLVVTFQNNAVAVLDKQQHIPACGVKEHSLFCLVQPPIANYSSGAPIYVLSKGYEPQPSLLGPTSLYIASTMFPALSSALCLLCDSLLSPCTCFIHISSSHHRPATTSSSLSSSHHHLSIALLAVSIASANRRHHAF
jgi:hypothetical protein